jgi:hypothetical protein
MNDRAMLDKLTAAVATKAAAIVQTPAGYTANDLEQAKRTLVSPTTTAGRMIGGIVGTAEIQIAWLAAGAEGSCNGQTMDQIINYLVGAWWTVYANQL